MEDTVKNILYFKIFFLIDKLIIQHGALEPVESSNCQHDRFENIPLTLKIAKKSDCAKILPGWKIVQPQHMISLTTNKKLQEYPPKWEQNLTRVLLRQ